MFRLVANGKLASFGAKKLVSGPTFGSSNARMAKSLNVISTRSFIQTTIWSQQANIENSAWSTRQSRMLEDQEFNTAEEATLFKKLLKEYDPAALSVQDISGGCGSMYAIHITSNKFNDLTIIKQHQLVNTFLKEDIARWHGIQLITKKDKLN